MKKIIIASKNQIKIDVTREAVNKLFPQEEFEFASVDVEIGGAEPVGDEKTQAQVEAAIKSIKKSHPGAAYYVAMEGGVRETNNGMEEVAFVIVGNDKDETSFSRSVSFPVPPAVAKKVREGMSFGDAVDSVYGTTDIKTKQGFIGLLTDNVIRKRDLYFQPLVVAFSKYKNRDWFWKV